MASNKIKGRIIRILDKRTIVVNLGSEHGITNSSIFYILGEPEVVVDPLTNQDLGTVRVSKSRVKASQVFDNFTIATTSWTSTYATVQALNLYLPILSGLGSSQTKEVDEGELNVDPKEIRPWKAKSESPVKVGDEVEVTVEEEDEDDDEGEEEGEGEAAGEAKALDSQG